MSNYCIITTTASTKDEAKALAKGLLSSHLASCIQIQPIESLYIWEGKLQEDSEYLLTIKTRSTHYKNVEKFILENHSYNTPEIIKIDINDGSKSYLKWIDETTAPKE